MIVTGFSAIYQCCSLIIDVSCQDMIHICSSESKHYVILQQIFFFFFWPGHASNQTVLQVMGFLIHAYACLKFNVLVFFEKGRQIWLLKIRCRQTVSFFANVPFHLLFNCVLFGFGCQAHHTGWRSGGLMLLSVPGEKALKHLDNTHMRAAQCNSVFSWQGDCLYQLDMG